MSHIELTGCTQIDVSGVVFAELLSAADVSHVELTDCESVDVHDFISLHAQGSAVKVTTSTRCMVYDGQIIDAGQTTDNTYDGIEITGGEGCHVERVMIRSELVGQRTRYGVNVASGSCHVVVGNDLGDPADYGTDALNDAGTSTRLFFPADATYGDNFTVCAGS